MSRKRKRPASLIREAGRCSMWRWERGLRSGGGSAALRLGGDGEVDVLIAGHGDRIHDLFEDLELDVLVRLDDGDPVEVLRGVEELVVVLQGHQLVVQLG